jgi:hypothetical protein
MGKERRASSFYASLIFTTFSFGGAVANAAQAFISVMRFSNNVVRLYAASTLLSTLCASAASTTSCSVLVRSAARCHRHGGRPGRCGWSPRKGRYLGVSWVFSVVSRLTSNSSTNLQ